MRIPNPPRWILFFAAVDLWITVALTHPIYLFIVGKIVIKTLAIGAIIFLFMPLLFATQSMHVLIGYSLFVRSIEEWFRARFK